MVRNSAYSVPKDLRATFATSKSSPRCVTYSTFISGSPVVVLNLKQPFDDVKQLAHCSTAAHEVLRPVAQPLDARSVQVNATKMPVFYCFDYLFFRHGASLSLSLSRFPGISGLSSRQA